MRHIISFLLGALALTASAQTPFRTDFRHNTDTTVLTQYGLRHGPRRAMSTTGENGLGIFGQSGKGTVPSIGSPRIPVIMVAYSDRDFLPTTDADKVSRWLNEEGYHDEGYAVGSVADYFRDNSYGHFSPSFEVVARVTVSQPMAYYGGHSGSSTNDIRPTALVKEAIDLAYAQGVDFSRFVTDGKVPIVSIVHAGPGEHEDYGYRFNRKDTDDAIWAHYRAYSNTVGGTTIASYIITNETMRDFDGSGNVTTEEMTGIGTFCHEFCHALGLPDMYDVNHATNGEAQTPGLWDVMDYQFMYNGYRPGCLSAYERCCLGWLDIPELPLTTAGDYGLLPLDGEEDGDGAHRARAFRLTNPANPLEYFILENRQSSTWHAVPYLGSGMLVWHIDYSASLWNSNYVNVDATHRHVAVVPADGAWQQPSYDRVQYPGDPFPGSTGVTRFDASAASYYMGTFAPVLYDIEERTTGTVAFRAVATLDVNGDGKIDAADATAIASVVTETAPSSLSADVNHDGRLSVSDVTTWTELKK